MENENLLLDLYKKNTGKVSDKWISYLEFYNELFKSNKEKKLNILEIGVQNGGSLEIWAKYFQNAQIIIGCDILEKCANLQFEDKRINIVVGNANEQNTKETILKNCSDFDLIIDDGSHNSSDIVANFCTHFPSLKEGGIYIIEDIHCNYWEKHEGGLFDPISAISFIKLLIDVVNFEHWGIPMRRDEYLKNFFNAYNTNISDHDLSFVHSVKVLNSLCVIEKAPALSNQLGLRIVSGAEAVVVPLVVNAHDTFLPIPDQTQNKRNTLPQPIPTKD